jgi:adenylate cyclase
MPNPPTERRKLAAIMFTDMVGYSAVVQRSEALALELLEEHRNLLRAIFPGFNGTEIKTIGDAFLVEFLSAVEAVRCAIEIQRALAKRNHDFPSDQGIGLKIGIHIGDVVHRAGDVYGDGVNIASRIEPLAGAGGICVSMDVERQVRNVPDIRLEKLASTELKNIQEPMELFRIVLPWEKQQSSSPGPKQSFSRTNPIRRTVFAGLALLIFLGLIWLLIHPIARMRQSAGNPQPNEPRAAPAAPELAGQKSVAVLPFVNLSPDKGDEYLSDGMTEELLNALAKVKGLRVPGRSSSFAFKGRSDEDIFRKVGEQLHVNTVLEGSVRKAGTKLRITAQLINVADGFHLWSETYDREMADIFAIQSDVAQRVATALKGQLLAGEKQQLARKPTENLEAYGLYLKGRYYMTKDTEEAFRKGIESYEKAIELDPNYALAYAGLADAYGALGGVFGFVSPTETFPKSRAAALKAIELDETLAEAHVALANYKLSYEWNWQEAEREFKRALELNPNSARAHNGYGGYLQAQGRFNEAIAARRQGQKLEPLSPDITANVGYPYYYARQYDQAIACYREALEMEPNYFWASLWIGQAFVQQGKYDEAITEMNKAVNLSGRNVRTVASLAHAYAVSGRRDEAVRLLDELKQRSADSYVAPYFVAVVLAGLGENDAVFQWLDKACEERFPYLYLLKVEPVFSGLHSDPRFVALLRKVHLEP